MRACQWRTSSLSAPVAVDTHPCHFHLVREGKQATLPVALGWAWLGTLSSRGLRWGTQECGRLGKNTKEGRCNLPSPNDKDADDGGDGGEDSDGRVDDDDDDDDAYDL